jgi:hypothetical protein
MAETVRLRIEVEDDGIIVTLPGTTFHVIYRKTNETPGLVQIALQADKSAGISQADFLAAHGGQLVTRRENSAGLSRAWVISEAPATGGAPGLRVPLRGNL